MMNDEVPNSDELREISETFGDFLKRHREASGKTLDEIARVTRISRRYLLAFEENDIKNLPEPAFARGFLRNYAVEVGIDADECLQRFDRYHRSLMPTQIKDVRKIKKSTSFELTPGGLKPLKVSSSWMAAGVGGAVLVLLFILYFSFSGSVDETAHVVEVVDEAQGLEAELDETSTTGAGLVTPVPPSVLQVDVTQRVSVVVRLDESASQEIIIEPGQTKSFDVYRQIEIRNVNRDLMSFRYNGNSIEAAGTTVKLFNQFMFSD